MFRNYLKTTIRSLMKNKTFSFINIIGLALGTLCCLYIITYVETQFSYDKHHKDADHIFRVTTKLAFKGDKHSMGTSSPPIAPAMKNDFPEVAQFTRVVPSIGQDRHLLRYKEKSIYEEDAVYVDSTFFDVFSYHFQRGNSKTPLSDPYTLVMMNTTAEKLFGKEDPIGKEIEISDGYEKNNFKVTGVVDESLGKSHLHANLFFTMNSGGLGEYVRHSSVWAGNNFAFSYVKLQPNADPGSLEAKLPAFLNKYGQQQFRQMGMEKQLQLQNIKSVHTTPEFEVAFSKTVSPTFLYILLLIAIMIQVIACINFMNLSTARASKRAREVGVRKVIGAQRADLVRQFLGESFMLSVLGVIIAIPLLLVALPYLNKITEADIRYDFLAHTRIWIWLAGIVLVTGLLAGSYPAFYLSAFEAIKVLKGNFTNSISATGIRKSLVVFQFSLSIILIAGIIVIFSQLKYVEQKDLGFDQKQRMVFSFYTADSKKMMKGFAEDLRHLPEVSAVSASNNYLSQFVFNDHGVFLAGGNMTNAVDARNMTTDQFFVKANGIRIISGRDFRQFDSGKVLVNEALIRRLGLTADKAPGTFLYTHYEPEPEYHVEIAGVMKDFNFISLHDEVQPFMLQFGQDEDNFSHLVVATNSKDYKTLLGKIETIWKKDLSSTPFEFAFLDEKVQMQYKTEITLSRIINSFTLMAIFISCLGLFGLAAFSAEQRRKEIGVRKVLGASVPGIVRLLSKDFLKLVGISILIATPVSWWAMNKWLQAFAYRVPLQWWMFALAGLFAVLISMVTVSFQSVRAALANPTKSIRTE